MNKDIQRLYDHCLRNMKNTHEDWDKVKDAFCKLYNLLDCVGKNEALECYDRIAEDVERRDASQQ